MDLQDRGFQTLAALREPKAPAAAALAAALGLGVTSRLGAHPLTSAAGASLLGFLAWKATSPSSTDHVGELDFSHVKVTLNLSEAVILPLTGGLLLSMSDNPEARRNGLGVLAVGAIGSLLVFHAIQKKDESVGGKP